MLSLKVNLAAISLPSFYDFKDIYRKPIFFSKKMTTIVATIVAVIIAAAACKIIYNIINKRH